MNLRNKILFGIATVLTFVAVHGVAARPWIPYACQNIVVHGIIVARHCIGG